MNRYESDRWGDQQQPQRPRKLDTPGGFWVKRDVDIHRCNKPSYSSTVKNGDIWECGTCHTQWVVKIGFDQRDNSTWITWTKHDRDIGLYAPGTR